MGSAAGEVLVTGYVTANHGQGMLEVGSGNLHPKTLRPGNCSCSDAVHEVVVGGVGCDQGLAAWL